MQSLQQMMKGYFIVIFILACVLYRLYIRIRRYSTYFVYLCGRVVDTVYLCSQASGAVLPTRTSIEYEVIVIPVCMYTCTYMWSVRLTVHTMACNPPVYCSCLHGPGQAGAKVVEALERRGKNKLTRDPFFH